MSGPRPLQVHTVKALACSPRTDPCECLRNPQSRHSKSRTHGRFPPCAPLHCQWSLDVKIKKAVITAAGEKQRLLPLQTLIDRDGEEKSVLGILIEQALLANIEEVCVVVWPGDEERCAQAVARHLGHVRFVPQPRPLRYGHAV